MSTSAGRFRMFDGWVLDELRTRPEAVKALEAVGDPNEGIVELHAGMVAE